MNLAPASLVHLLSRCGNVLSYRTLAAVRYLVPNGAMFDLTTSRDFYAMLVEDFDDFMAEPHSARRALHCAITAYHLYEWIWGDWLKTDYDVQVALRIRDRDSFCQRIVDHCPWFSFIKSLANGTKHFVRKEQGFQAMRVGGYDPYDAGYLVIDFGEDAAEHRLLPAAHLLEVVVRFWRDFFRMYRFDSDLPVRKYHVV